MKDNKRPLVIGVIALFIIVLITIGWVIFHYKHHPYQYVPDYKYIPNVADNIYNFLDDWASAFAPGLTLILAIAAFWVIWQNYKFREKDRKERVLNEIIEWAENAADIAISRQTRKSHELWKTMLEYKKYLVKSKYIEQLISSSSLEIEELSGKVKDVVNKIEFARSTVERYIQERYIKEKLENDLIMSEQDLAKSVENLIIEIAQKKLS